MIRTKDLLKAAKRAGSRGSRAGGRRLAYTAAFALALVAAGCGWRPLYERPSADPASGGVGAALAQVSIDPVVQESGIDPFGGSDQALYDARAAQLLQNHLKQALNPGGEPSSAPYYLAVELEQRVNAMATTGDGQATWENLTMTATYHLNDAKGKVVLEDEARIVTSYNVLQDPLSPITSRRDAQQRGAQELADAIQTRLAVFLRK